MQLSDCPLGLPLKYFRDGIKYFRDRIIECLPKAWYPQELAIDLPDSFAQITTEAAAAAAARYRKQAAGRPHLEDAFCKRERNSVACSSIASAATP